MAGPSLVVQVGANIDALRTEMTKAGGTFQTFQASADQAGGRLMDFGTKGQDAAPKIGGLSTSLRTFDSALASMGVHIGPEIRALGELGNASGKTASQLGLVATAGFALAAGIGGWKIGRLIADFTGSDKAIGDAVASLMGWTDAAQRAGAVSDVMALAIRNGAAANITFAEAVRLNAEAADDLALRMGRSTNATHDTMVAVSGWQREIRAVRSNGDLPALTADLESQNFTVKELSVKYGIHVEALNYFARSQKASAAEVKAATDAHDSLAASVRAYYNMVGEREIETQRIQGEALAKREADLRAFYNWIGERQMEDMRRTIEVEAAKAAAIAGAGQALMDEAIAEHTARVAAAQTNDVMAQTAPIARAAAAGVTDLSDAFNRSAGVIVGASSQIAAAIGAIPGGSHGAFGWDATERAYINAGYGWNIPPHYQIPGGPPIVPMAAGGPVSAGSSYMVGERGPELFVPRASGSIVPNGGGTTITNYITVTQPFGTPDAIGEAILTRQRALGERF